MGPLSPFKIPKAPACGGLHSSQSSCQKGRMCCLISAVLAQGGESPLASPRGTLIFRDSGNGARPSTTVVPRAAGRMSSCRAARREESAGQRSQSLTLWPSAMPMRERLCTNLGRPPSPVRTRVAAIGRFFLEPASAWPARSLHGCDHRVEKRQTQTGQLEAGCLVPDVIYSAKQAILV